MNLSIINILPDHAADIYIKLKSITSKLHNTSASTAFIKKAFVNGIPKFAIVKGQFINLYQRAILGPSSSDSVATLENKFGKIFCWVCMSFNKKASQKNGILIKTG